MISPRVFTSHSYWMIIRWFEDGWWSLVHWYKTLNIIRLRNNQKLMFGGFRLRAGWVCRSRTTRNWFWRRHGRCYNACCRNCHCFCCTIVSLQSWQFQKLMELWVRFEESNKMVLVHHGWITLVDGCGWHGMTLQYLILLDQHDATLSQPDTVHIVVVVKVFTLGESYSQSRTQLCWQLLDHCVDVFTFHIAPWFRLYFLSSALGTGQFEQGKFNQ